MSTRNHSEIGFINQHNQLNAIVNGGPTLFFAILRSGTGSCQVVMAQALGLCNLRDGLPAPENRDLTEESLRGLFDPIFSHWEVQMKLHYMIYTSILRVHMNYIYMICVYTYIV